MSLIARLHRTVLGAFLTTPVTLLFAASALAAEGSAAGLTLHGPEETLRDFCVEQDGVLWLVLPGGERQELVTSTADPAILNPGDGSFHPFEEAQVLAALAALRAPVAPLRADVFLLPYPRRSGLESAAGPGLILLSPGVRPLSPAQQHAEFVHELGHLVHYTRMPDVAAAEWSRYREIRGITDQALYSSSAAHANRPHEIFAEDFRALIGGALANYSGTIENAALAPPASVGGLAEFMRSVAGGSAPLSEIPLVCYPNPSREAVSFVRSGGGADALEVYDLAGRSVATLAPVATAGLVTWRWDGHDRSGAPVGAGVFFARSRAERGVVRVTRIR